MPWKLSFSTLACPQWTLDQMVQAAAANGIAGIDFRGIGQEIDITRARHFSADLDATLKLLADHRIALPCFNTSVTLVTPAMPRWQMMLDECQRYAELATRTGTRFLRIFGGVRPREMSDDEARQLGQRHLRQLIKLCKSACPTAQLVLETHDHWAASRRVLEMLHETDPADVGVLWDFEHPVRQGEAPAETGAALRRYLRHIHIKDSLRQSDKCVPRLLGEGELPLPACLKALADIGYDGWICLETEKRWHMQTAPEPEVSIPQFARYMSAP